jgi:cold shock CspA family protein
MRTHGTLKKWNDERGFGFIESAMGAEEIFIHISAFPQDGIRPRIGELISFELDIRSDGRKRALRAMRPGTRRALQRAPRMQPKATRQNPLVSILGLLAIVAIAGYVYSTHTANRFSTTNEPTTGALPAASPAQELSQLPFRAKPTVRTTPIAPVPSFTCDGRTMCSQMTSCAEATYFLNHCPATRMDGDGDGEPCERQWCSSSY